MSTENQWWVQTGGFVFKERSGVVKSKNAVGLNRWNSVNWWDSESHYLQRLLSWDDNEIGWYHGREPFVPKLTNKELVWARKVLHLYLSFTIFQF